MTASMRSTSLPRVAVGIAGWEAFAQFDLTTNYHSGYMYQRYGESLSAEQIDALLAFVLSLH